MQFPGMQTSSDSEPDVSSALLVDDHGIFRRGLREILLALRPGIEIVECATAAQARELLPVRSWSLVVLDQSLPDGFGIDLLDGSWAARSLVLSMHGDALLANLCRERGAAGFLCKADPVERLEDALRRLLAGIPRPPGFGRSRGAPVLSERELEVLRALLAGERPQALARRMGISRSSVQSYRERLFRKLEVDSLPEFVRKCDALGLPGSDQTVRGRS